MFLTNLYLPSDKEIQIYKNLLPTYANIRPDISTARDSYYYLNFIYTNDVT